MTSLGLPHCLTIAGSDSGGGAGLQADLRTFAKLGVYGTSVVTTVTAQNTKGIFESFDVPAHMIFAQCNAVFSDYSVKAIKIGALRNADIVSAVRQSLLQDKRKNIVLDPVLKSKNNFELCSSEAFSLMVEKLFPLCLLVTPNIPEAEVLLKVKITSCKGMEDAARALLRWGPQAVLVKGGHLPGDSAVDVLILRERSHEPIFFKSPRLGLSPYHGTGCTLSAAIAAHLALGFDLESSVKKSKDYLSHLLLKKRPVFAWNF